MEQQRTAVFILKSVREDLKKIADDNKRTVPGQIAYFVQEYQEEFTERCPTCGGVNGEHKEVLVQHANNDGGVISDEVTAMCPEQYEA